MSGSATPGTPAVVEEPSGAAQDTDATKQVSESKPPAATPPVGKEPDVYDTAFDEFMGPEAKDPALAPSSEFMPPKDLPPGETKAPAESQEPGTKPGDGTTQASELSDDQAQLLKRQHIDPKMIVGWSDEQKKGFFENAQKREADQTTSYKSLSDKLETLTKTVEQGGQQIDPKAGGQSGDKGKAGNPPADFSTQAQKVSDQLVEDFGPEIGDAGKLLVTMAKSLDEARGQITKASGQIETSNQGSKLSNQVIVELTLENGIRDLVGDYPSLSKDAVRQQVITKFEDSWKAADSPHRNGKGPILPRIQKALAEAAKLELGTSTEIAAQVALANRTKERLRQQPTPGHSKGKQAPRSEDELYDQAFNETLRPEISHL